MPSTLAAIARARIVFAVPGTSSSSTWPPATSADSTSRISSPLPWTTVSRLSIRRRATSDRRRPIRVRLVASRLVTSSSGASLVAPESVTELRAGSPIILRQQRTRGPVSTGSWSSEGGSNAVWSLESRECDRVRSRSSALVFLNGAAASRTAGASVNWLNFGNTAEREPLLAADPDHAGQRRRSSGACSRST